MSTLQGVFVLDRSLEVPIGSSYSGSRYHVVFSFDHTAYYAEYTRITFSVFVPNYSDFTDLWIGGLFAYRLRRLRIYSCDQRFHIASLHFRKNLARFHRSPSSNSWTSTSGKTLGLMFNIEQVVNTGNWTSSSRYVNGRLLRYHIFQLF